MTTIERYQAIPTEYSKTAFRSKTEAIFARAMDIQQVFWVYEPGYWMHESGWTPDFRLTHRGFSSAKRWVIWDWCVKLKPQQPTDSYLTRVSEMFCSMEDRLMNVWEAVIVCNPFDPAVERQVLVHRAGEWEEDSSKIGWLFFGAIEKAMTYRFDLQH